MAKLQKFRIVEEKPVPSSRFRQTLEAIRGVWMGPISVSSPDIARLFGSQPTATGVQVDHQTALNYSAVWAAVDLISSQIGNLPLVLYSKDSNGGKTRMDWHPLYRLIHDRPNPETSAFIFR
ncbi:MAG TPA: phage portal protein, partial [Candidatus Dormibacteraeota bacterium]|nr:phage portal protein [Candidatus Dormibacteraeota bacterium]